MTTGRINQVTIVTPGWPTAFCNAEEILVTRKSTLEERSGEDSGFGKA